VGKNIEDNASWFRDTPHYWAGASLPLAYAVACVEIVCKNSEKARIIYKRIVEAWSDAGIKAMGEEIASMIPESGKAKIKKAMLHPETELLPDPNRPFKELERLFTEVEIDGELLNLEGTEELEKLISVHHLNLLALPSSHLSDTPHCTNSRIQHHRLQTVLCSKFIR